MTSPMHSPLQSPLQPVMRSPLEFRRRGGGSFDPITALFGSGQQGVLYDPSVMSSLFQDSAGTIPVTAADQTVGKMLDLSGNGNHATQADASKRPILRNSGALWWLEFDGVNDFMATASVDFSAVDKMSAWAGTENTSGAGALISSGAYVTNSGSFEIAQNEGATNYAVLMTGSPAGYSKTKFSPVTSGVDNVITAYADRSLSAASETTMSINGVSVTGTQEQPGVSGNFGNYAIYIASRGGTVQFSSAPVFFIAMAGALYDSETISAMNTWTAARCGVTL